MLAMVRKRALARGGGRRPESLLIYLGLTRRAGIRDTTIRSTRDEVHSSDLERVSVHLTAIAAHAAEEHAWGSIQYRRRHADSAWVWVEMHSTSRGRYQYGFITRADEAARAEAAYRDLLAAASFDLRCSAQSVLAASALLRLRSAVTVDAEAAFLVQAIDGSCDLLCVGAAAAQASGW